MQVNRHDCWLLDMKLCDSTDRHGICVSVVYVAKTPVSKQNKESIMLGAAVMFLVIALIAGVLGLVHTEILASNIAWILFVVFLVLALLSMVFGRSTRPID
jgi:uncharacterized membrane protein YtjA (UPF0391 family)